MKFDSALELFKHLLELDEQRMRTNLTHFVDENKRYHQEVSKLIEAHYQNEEHTSFNQIIANQTGSLLHEESTSNLVGRQVGAYLLTNKLGQGGMGTVYLGERNDGALIQKVAIKFVHSSILTITSDDFLQREAQHLANLEHHNIARIYTIEKTLDNMPYIVMEYINGVPLDEYCASNNLTLKARLRLFSKVCDAVQLAHQNMIIHCDIKPSNILVDLQGEPKLLDFGIASNMDQQLSNNEAKIKAASKSYSSPEQIAGKPLTTASDIYSLCRLLQELVTCYSDKELAAALARGTEQIPAQRFKSVNQLTTRIRERLVNKPIEEYSNSGFYRVKKAAVRNKLSFLLSAGVLLLGLAFSVKSYSDYQKIVEETQKFNAMNTFLVDMLRSANPEHKQKSDVLVSEIIEQGYQDIYTKDLAKEVKTTLLYTLTKAYQYLGNFEQYIAKSKDALAYIEQYDPNNLKYLHLFNAMVGVAYEENSNYAKGLEYYYTSLSITEKDNNIKHISNALHQIGNASFELGQYQQSIDSFARSIALLDHDSANFDRDMAISLNSVGIAYSRSDQHLKAIEIYEQSKQHAVSHYGAEHTSTMRRSLNIAIEYTALKQCDRALSIYEDIAPIYQKVLRDTETNWLAFYEAKAKSLRCLQRFDEAMEQHKKSALVVDSNWGDDSYYYAVVQANSGITLFEQGNIQQASTRLQNALPIIERVVGKNHDRYIKVQEYLSMTLMEN